MSGGWAGDWAGTASVGSENALADTTGDREGFRQPKAVPDGLLSGQTAEAPRARGEGRGRKRNLQKIPTRHLGSVFFQI